jgi:pantoate--beta-alanine ligase
MGALHFGHVQLVKTARQRCDRIVVSIFVNPSQFSAGEDLDKYPRQLQQDLDILRRSFATNDGKGGVDAVFCPSVGEMYPAMSDKLLPAPLCHVEPSAFSNILEGASRPEFFRGVATVVTKLFNIVQPTTAFFGQKDISQCILLKRMVRDLSSPVNIHICHTVRDDANGGLAMSSRNAYLSSAELPKAGVLITSLRAAETYYDKYAAAHGRRIAASELVNEVHRVLLKEPFVTSVEYVSVASVVDMTELQEVSIEHGAVLSSAIKIGSVRLIDNILLGRAARDAILSDNLP